MDIAELKKLIADLPDEMEVIIEASTGQKEVSRAEVCTHQYDGMHHVEGDKEWLAEDKGFVPDYFETLEKPTFKITMRY